MKELHIYVYIYRQRALTYTKFDIKYHIKNIDTVNWYNKVSRFNDWPLLYILHAIVNLWLPSYQITVKIHKEIRHKEQIANWMETSL